MKLKQKVVKGLGSAQAEKLVVLKRQAKGKGARVVTQAMLKNACQIQQLHAVSLGHLRELLEKSADIEPGRYILRGNVFRCEKCGRFWVEEGRDFWAVDAVVNAEEHGHKPYRSGPVEGQAPENECPHCLAIEVLGGGDAA